MIQNVGEVDRVVRVVVGVVGLLIAYSVMNGTGQIIVYVVGLILMITGLVGFCPLYKLFGISTN